MYDPRYVLRSFDVLGADDKMAILRGLLDALVLVDTLYLKAVPTTPALYDAGLRYEPEELGRDDWRDVPAVLDHRGGDCEDLACWRVSELRLRYGVQASPYVTSKLIQSPKYGAFTLYHIRVAYPVAVLPQLFQFQSGTPDWIELDGATVVEDPSRRLGMPA